MRRSLRGPRADAVSTAPSLCAIAASPLTRIVIGRSSRNAEVIQPATPASSLNVG